LGLYWAGYICTRYISAAEGLRTMTFTGNSNIVSGIAGRGIGFETASVMPPKVSVFGLEISETIIIAWIVMAIIIILAVLFRIFILKKFKPVPKGIQNVLEIIIGFFENFSKGKLGKRYPAVAPYMFTVAVMIVGTCMAEMLGFRPPATDINFTFAIALMSFIMINIFGLYYTGFFGRIRWFFKPMPFMLPVNIITHIIIPVSLAFRLFGNMFAGLIVMDLLYGVVFLKFGIPAFLAIYFNLFHVGIQTYIFMTLSLTFAEETVAYGAKR
jgi:F-type H+-transporting ATPase subunit a